MFSSTGPPSKLPTLLQRLLEVVAGEELGVLHELVGDVAMDAMVAIGKIRICKVDIDHNPSIPMNYGVRAVPTLLLFKGGEVIDQRVGALNHKALQDFVDQAL